LSLVEKLFVVSVANIFVVSVGITDTLCMILEISRLWCQLVYTNTKNPIYGLGYLSGPTRKIDLQK
jgi:hypothetical protein